MTRKTVSSRSRRGRHGGHGIERRRRRALQVRWGMREAERASSSSWGRGKKISRRRQGGRRWRPYPPRGACSSVAGEVVRRRPASCSDAHRGTVGETTGAVSWAWPTGPVSVALGPGAGGVPFSFLFLHFYFFSPFTECFAIFLELPKGFCKMWDLAT